MANVKAAKEFVKRWKTRGDEKQETQAFWIELLDKVYEDHDYMNHVLFEVVADKVEGGSNFKDVVINRGTDRSVLIEQKSSSLRLDKTEVRFGGNLVTPFEQAKHYDDLSAVNDKARWIITCNFREFWIYDMTKTGKDLYVPIAMLHLEDLPTHLNWLNMITVKDKVNPVFIDEVAVSNEAGRLVGVMYDALKQRFADPDSDETFRNLNKLCVRIVFCLYAEDAGLFDKKNRKVFHDYLVKYDAQKTRKALMELFKVLNQKEHERDEFLQDDDPLLASFPYVNGGLFEGDVKIPPFDDEIRDILLNRMSLGFDWSAISPTIFGSVFESTLNPETRRQSGMHYTSIENIHKVIDPLFLDDLKIELNEILRGKQPNVRDRKLREFQDKIASLKFLDPAAGSGNFLTESYISLRALENSAIKALIGNSLRAMELDADASQIKVSINQFYGIEINDFAVAVAKTALWIAEAQMFEKTQEILSSEKEFLPLHEYDNIKEGNALRMDWNDVIPASELNYLMGNPPFIGHQMRNASQVHDMSVAFHDLKNHGKLDYVCAWYAKAAEIMQGRSIKTAFVSTNSICQGESVAIFWGYLFSKHVEIQFAHRTFIWNSEAIHQAHVHCVIVGFTCFNSNSAKHIYENGIVIDAKHINGYLVDADDLFVKSRTGQLNTGYPEMFKGSQATDNLGLILEPDEYREFTKLYPQDKDLVKPYMGSYEMINGKDRYCFWLKDIPASRYANNAFIKKRLHSVAEFRKQSKTESVRELSSVPYLFTQIRQPESDYLAFPAMSSSRRKYIPICYISKQVIASNQLYLIPDASIELFSILTSNCHMLWMDAICGRLKSDYRYAPAVYHNFPIPHLTESQKEILRKCGNTIIEIRKKHAGETLAELYDPLLMPLDLLKAHEANDKAVMEAYGFKKGMTESEIVAELMKMYQKLTATK